MGTTNEKEDAKTLGFNSLSRHRVRGRGTASAVEGANFVLLRNFYVRCSVKLLALGATLFGCPARADIMSTPTIIFLFEYRFLLKYSANYAIMWL